MTSERLFARAIGKMHTDATGVVGPNPDNDPPWLNALDEVDGIVRVFASEMLKRLADPDAKAFNDWVASECQRLNTLFLGYEPGEQSYGGWKRGPWNTPLSLGSFARALYIPADEDDRFAVRDLFMAYAVEIAGIVVQHQGEPVERWGDEMSAPTERIVRALLGFPPGNDSEIEGISPILYRIE